MITHPTNNPKTSALLEYFELSCGLVRYPEALYGFVLFLLSSWKSETTVDGEPEEREGKEEKVDEVRPPLLLFCFQTSLLRTLTVKTPTVMVMAVAVIYWAPTLCYVPS